MYIKTGKTFTVTKELHHSLKNYCTCQSCKIRIAMQRTTNPMVIVSKEQSHMITFAIAKCAKVSSLNVIVQMVCKIQ